MFQDSVTPRYLAYSQGARRSSSTHCSPQRLRGEVGVFSTQCWPLVAILKGYKAWGERTGQWVGEEEPGAREAWAPPPGTSSPGSIQQGLRESSL